MIIVKTQLSLLIGTVSEILQISSWLSLFKSSLKSSLEPEKQQQQNLSSPADSTSNFTFPKLNGPDLQRFKFPHRPGLRIHSIVPVVASPEITMTRGFSSWRLHVWFSPSFCLMATWLSTDRLYYVFLKRTPALFNLGSAEILPLAGCVTVKAEYSLGASTFPSVEWDDRTPPCGGKVDLCEMMHWTHCLTKKFLKV